MRILIIFTGSAVGVFLLLNAINENFNPSFQTSIVEGISFPKKIKNNDKTLVVATPPRRIVSCTFFADEIVMALVETNRIEAVTFMSDLKDYCSMHEIAKKVPHRVRSIRDVERLIELRPDLIIVDPFNTPDASLLLAKAGLCVLKIDYPRSISQVEQNILMLGEILGAQKEANRLVNEIENVKRQIVSTDEKPRVLYLLGPTCPTKGTLLHDIIEAAGGKNITSDKDKGRFIYLSLEHLIDLDPDVIFVGGSVLPDVLRHGAADSLKAKRSGKLYLISPIHLESASHLIANAIMEISQHLHGKHKN